MNTFLLILFIVILLIIIIAITYISLYNKINESIIRVDEAENRIDSNLRDKYDIIDRAINIFKSKIELDKDAFKDFIQLKLRKISSFDLDRILVSSYHEFLLNYNKKEFTKNEDLHKMKKQIELIDEELITLRSYYNANITNYNKLIKKFPTMLIAKIKKYKERPFYDLKDMHDEDMEDFKL